MRRQDVLRVKNESLHTVFKKITWGCSVCLGEVNCEEIESKYSLPGP